MTSSNRVHLHSACYCAVLISLNWSFSVEYGRELGRLRESTFGIGGAVVLSAGVTLYLLYRCVRLAKAHLESGTGVGPGRWFPDLEVLVYSLPLLYRHSMDATWTAPDGALATRTGGFGHELSTTVFSLSICSLLLYQVFLRLREATKFATPDAGGNKSTARSFPAEV